MQPVSIKKQIILAYRRRPELVDGVHLVDGYFETKVNDGSFRGDFEGNTFTEVMLEFSELAKQTPDAELFMMRLEQKPQPIAMHLDERQSKMLRESIDDFIVELSPPPQRIVIRKKSKVQVEDSVVFKAGFEALADTFGDNIFFLVQRGCIECPSCGRWVELQERTGANPSFRFAKCSCDYMTFGSAIESTRSWLKVFTEDLLFSRTDRYFIRRPWNSPGPWITHEALKQRYEKYLKEKACTEIKEDR